MKNIIIVMALILLVSCGEDSPFGDGDSDELRIGFDISNNECQAACEITFTNTSEFAESFMWDFDDGSTISREENPTHLFENAGVYDVTLTITKGTESKVQSQRIRILPRSDQPTIIQTHSLALHTIGLDIVEFEGDLMILAQSNNDGSALFSNTNTNHLMRVTKSGELIDDIGIPKEWEINDIEVLGSVIYVVGKSNEKAFIAQVDAAGNVLDIEQHLIDLPSSYRKISFVEGGRPVVIGTVSNGSNDFVLLHEYDAALNLRLAYEFIDVEADLKAVDISFSDDKIYLAYNATSSSVESGILESYDKSSFARITSYNVPGEVTGITSDASGVYLISTDERREQSGVWKFNHDLEQLQFSSVPALEVSEPYPTDIIRHRESTIINTSNLDFDSSCLAKSIFHVYNASFGLPDVTAFLDCAEYGNNGFYTVNMISDGDNVYAVGLTLTSDEEEQMFLLIDNGEF